MATPPRELFADEAPQKRAFFNAEPMQSGFNPFAYAQAKTGLIAATPAPTYNAAGAILTATIDGSPFVCTYDANGNLASSTYSDITHVFTWALGANNQYVLTSVQPQ